MTSVRFNDYDQLNSYINSLRPPKPGHVRVFRGQYRFRIDSACHAHDRTSGTDLVGGGFFESIKSVTVSFRRTRVESIEGV
jgi:hypothetical protein